MKSIILAGMFTFAAFSAFAASPEADVRHAVERFYAAFNNGFVDGADAFATNDWNHINPSGGRTTGRAEVLKEVVRVHATFLKGVAETVESMDVRFATSGSAVATVVSRSSPFTSPDGVRHEHSRSIRTFVVVKRQGRWLIMQDQNTPVTGNP